MIGVMMPPLEGGKEGCRAAMVRLVFVEKLEESKRAAGILFVHAVSYLLGVDRDRLG